MFSVSTLPALLAVVLAANVYAASNPIVDVGYARYQGALDPSTNITSFIGVRFAAPPLRFAAPQPPAKVSGVQIANTASPECFQGSDGTSVNQTFHKRVTDSEDCLFLNVFLPGQLSTTPKLPVVVWIHGGGYVKGSAVGLDGGDLIRDAQGGVIAVTIQYRLGVFGFLAGAETKNRGALNAGLLDQTFALQWVQKHIAAFGGDPNRVTIWGQSAGAGSVLQHVVANGGRTNPPLFHAAITSSTFLPSQHNFDDPVPEQIYADVAAQTKCSAASDTFACLQNVDASILQAANSNISLSGFLGTFIFVPVVDGKLIVERPTQTLAKGRVNGKLYLGMTNQFEGRNFVKGTVTTGTLASYVGNLFPGLGSAQVNQVVQAYSNIGLTDTLNQAIAVMGESTFICPTYFLLKAFSSASYKGEFAIPPANHADDTKYYFLSNPGFNNTAFITSFSQSFLAIVKSSNPNTTPDPTNITPQWNLWSSGNTEMLFNRTTALQPDIRPITTDAGLLSRCSLWENLSAFTPQ
ncbi:cephalosporin esterase [Rickenella mellea]|uniref:Carboxylic ester hydrolase n=1 Tax=Rickenella mellea TaxID=50990 RepID=A0A4Y7Q4C3_9AGAM|nr:cephalosporin esterase [Rickenella mellea]